MEQAALCKKTACLMGKPRKMINVICKKISDWMEPSQPAFTIPSQHGRLASHFHKIPIEVGQPGLGLHIFRNFSIWQKKIKHGTSNLVKKETNHLR